MPQQTRPSPDAPEDRRACAELLERDSQLAGMVALLDGVERGQGGRCVLVYGEAGIGKTSFVRRFTDLQRERCELLWGGCEALFTPRPLGPLADMADALPPALGAGIDQGDIANRLYPALLTYLRDRKRPLLLVVEDVHWADWATLDLLKYLGRRIHSARSLLILTYRDDELSLDHPLRTLVGELPAQFTHRLPLPLLSENAVERLAKQAGRSPRGLFRATDGNPFFVTEALASRPGDIPTSVRDAVLARLAGLTEPAREVAELVSIAPSRLERVLVKTLLGPVAAALDECLDQGMLRADGGWLMFRHELARQSVEQSLPPGRLVTWHAQMFRALHDRGEGTGELSRRVHHAESAGLVDEVARLAPVAAAEAARVSAHREAAALYALALQHTDRLALGRRADLLEARAHSCALSNALDQAIEARLAALSLRREQGDTLAEGVNLRWLAHLYRFYTGEPLSLSYAKRAVQALEKLPPHRELAFAYCVLAWTSTLGEAPAAAVTWGDRAVALAKQLNDAEALAAALNASSSARLRTDDVPEAWVELKQGLALALENRFDELAARAFMSLMTLALVHRQLLAALDYAEQGIAFCKERDLDLYTARLHVRRGFAHMELGRWDEVANDLAQLDEAPTVTPLERETSRFLGALLNLRRGQPDVATARRELRESVPGLPPYSWYAVPASAGAEAAWLQDDSEGVDLVAGSALAAAITLGEPWRLGELAAWLQRVGRLPCGFDHPVAQPYALELAGDWRAAAAEWKRSGCPYQQGLALLAGDEAGLREALQIFDTLGAAPAAGIARQRLYALGARNVQRGPQASTRTDPQGLTRREREILELLLQNLSNPAIARKLHRSERTVEHHVSALISKLGVASRAEVIGRAQLPASARKK